MIASFPRPESSTITRPLCSSKLHWPTGPGTGSAAVADAVVANAIVKTIELRMESHPASAYVDLGKRHPGCASHHAYAAVAATLGFGV